MKEGSIEQQVQGGVKSAFEDFKNLFVPKASADLASAQAELGIARQSITDLTAQLAARDTEIVTLKANLATATTRAEAAEKLAKDTEASVTARANQQALGIEQRRGVSAPLKEEGTKDGGAGNGKSASQTYQELIASGKSAEAGRFYAENAEEIWKSNK